MLKGFKEFISRGNVIDLAVGVIIGGAFSPIVSSLTDNVIMPLIAAILGKPSFDEVGLFHIGSTPIMPGTVLTAVVNFLLIAAALYFCIVLPMNMLRKKEEVVQAPDASVELLTEIRDLLSRR